LSLEVPPPLMFPMTVMPLGRGQDCSLKNRDPDVLAFLVPGSWRLEQGRCGWTVLHLPWNLNPVPFEGHQECFQFLAIMNKAVMKKIDSSLLLYLPPCVLRLTEDENLWIASRLIWFDQPRPPDFSQTAPVKIGPSP
ncbi:hypothetical protein STEG23_021192, partial [Scotinomys teguina]